MKVPETGKICPVCSQVMRPLEEFGNETYKFGWWCPTCNSPEDVEDELEQLSMFAPASKNHYDHDR